MDQINKAPHYNVGSIEVIEVIDDWNLNFKLGNAIKYIGRCNHKGTKVQDLRKAIRYIEMEIEKEEKGPGMTVKEFAEQASQINKTLTSPVK